MHGTDSRDRKKFKNQYTQLIKQFIFIFFINASFVSCNSFNLANAYSKYRLKINGTHFHSLNTEKYNLTYWDTETDKPVLLLIHGFGTSGNLQWFKEADNLSKDYRLIIVNLLYFGSKPISPTYTVAGQVDAIVTLLIKLNINSCYICGTSYGGVIAAEFTLKYPEKIKKLIMMDTPLKFLTKEDTRNVCLKYNISNPEQLYIPDSPEMFKTLMTIIYKKKRKLPMPVIRTIYKNTYLPEKDNLHKIYETFMNETDVFYLKKYHYEMPVLLIWGNEDRLVPLHVGQQLKEYLGVNASLEIVSDAAHLPNLENEKAVTRLILSFLK